MERFTGYISEDTLNMMKQTVLSWDKGDKQTGVEHYLGVQILSDKTVADSVEALIGVYLKVSLSEYNHLNCRRNLRLY